MNENGNGNVYANSRYKIFNDLGLGDVRTYIDENGGIWFYMNDIARILDIKNPRDITANLHNSGLSSYVGFSDGGKTHINRYGVTGHTQVVKETTIKESALLYICGRSRKPNAQKLFRFVSEQVVPSLARYGGYIMPEDRAKYEQTPELVQDLVKAIDGYEDTIKAYDDYAKEFDGKYNELLDQYNELSEERDDLIRRLEEYENAEYGYSSYDDEENYHDYE